MIIVVLALVAGSTAHAQGTTTHYVYDDNGRLKAVIAPNGEANVYEYDPAGNITAIRRNASNILELLDFYPRTGTPGTTVTIVGTGFGGGVSSVAFNGTAAPIVSVNAPQLVVTVPAGATTGPITVTTPGGSATTSQPFTIKGVFVMPEAATIASLQSLQFTASLILPDEPDQSLIWSVDGIEGGNSVVGTISATGFYTAPPLPQGVPSTISRVRATSFIDPLTFGEAVVTVKNPEFIRPVFASYLSIRNGNSGNGTGLFSTAVSVRNGNSGNGTGLFSTTVSVRNGNTGNGAGLFSSAVSVRNGNSGNSTPVFGAPVKVRNGNEGTSSPLFSSQVSVSSNPTISSITPGQWGIGTTVNITVNGANLDGATSLTFFDIASAAFDTKITISNLSVNGAGTVITATLTIDGSASVGRRAVVVTASAGDSTLTDTVVNTAEIIP